MIEIKNIWYQYPADESNENFESYALQDISLQIRKGEFVAVLGPNGSGKSTLTRLLNGIYVPSRGEILIDGMSTIDADHLWQIRRKLQVVFQNPENQIVGSTLEEDVAFGLCNIGLPQEEMHDRISWVLELLGLQDKLQHPVHQLSGGEKQKLAVASVLALAPEYVILDEATSMLDPEARRALMDDVHSIQNTMGLTVVHITHHLDEALQADRIILMMDGRIKSAMSPHQLIRQQDLLQECGMEVPFLPALANRLKTAGLEISITPHVEELVKLICS